MWNILSLGPAGTDHERAAHRYAEYRGLGEYRVTLFDALGDGLPLIDDPHTLILANAAHPDVDLLTTVRWREVGVRDAFIYAIAPMALVRRPGCSDPRSITLASPARGYYDLTEWARVDYVRSKPLAAERVLAGESDEGIIPWSYYERHRDELELVEQVGPVECVWLLFGARNEVNREFFGIPLPGGRPHGSLPADPDGTP